MGWRLSRNLLQHCGCDRPQGKDRVGCWWESCSTGWYRGKWVEVWTSQRDPPCLNLNLSTRSTHSYCSIRSSGCSTQPPCLAQVLYRQGNSSLFIANLSLLFMNSYFLIVNSSLFIMNFSLLIGTLLHNLISKQIQILNQKLSLLSVSVHQLTMYLYVSVWSQLLCTQTYTLSSKSAKRNSSLLFL